MTGCFFQGCSVSWGRNKIILSEIVFTVFPLNPYHEVLAKNVRCTFKIKYWNHQSIWIGLMESLISFKVRVCGTIRWRDFSYPQITFTVSPCPFELLYDLSACWDTQETEKLQDKSSGVNWSSVAWILLFGREVSLLATEQ